MSITIVLDVRLLVYSIIRFLDIASLVTILSIILQWAPCILNARLAERNSSLTVHSRVSAFHAVNYSAARTPGKDYLGRVVLGRL